MAEIPPGDRVQADHDSFLRRDDDTSKAYRRVYDPDAVSLLEEIATALGADVTVSDPYFNSTSNPITPGAEQTLLTDVVPAGVTRHLSRVTIVCRQEGAGYILVNGDVVGSLRTGAASPNAIMEWSPRYPVAAGLNIEVTFISRTGAPISDVDCHLQAIDKPI